MAKSGFEREERIQFDLPEAEFSTLAVRSGQNRTMEGEHSDAIFPTSSFVYSSAREAAARFGGEEEGNIYSRFTNPHLSDVWLRWKVLSVVSLPLQECRPS
jgi:O-succinylhomoserine sulfhydrylase